MQLLTVVLGRPGTIGFATGLAHPRAPNLWGKQGWYTGQGIIAWDLTHGNYGSTTWTDSFVDSLLEASNTNDAHAHALEKEVTALLEEYRQLQAHIRATSPRYAALTQPQPLTLAEIQQQVVDED